MRYDPRSLGSGRESRRETKANGSPEFRIGLIAILAIMQLAATLMVPQGLTLTVITDTVGLLLTVSATLIFLENRSRSTGAVRLFWTLFAACWGTRTAVQIVWMYYDVILRHEAPNPFIGDVLLFLSNIPVLAALLLHTQQQRWEGRKLSASVDFTLLLLWWLHLYLYFVGPWQYVAFDEARYGFSYNWLNALVDVVLLLMAAYLIKHTSEGWRWFYGTFFGAQAFIALSGFLVNRAIDNHSYYPGSLYDVPYTLALGLFTVVGVFGHSLARESTDVKTENPFPLMRLGMLSLLSLPVITIVTVLSQNPPLRVARFREVVVQITVLAMAALILVRQRQLMAELAEAARVLHNASVTDSLTGCRNRRFLEAALPADASQALRSYASGDSERARDLVFYLVDLDNFKDVNDQYGHHIGDNVLVETSGRIKAVIRNSDVLVRWGGDEFLIVSRYSDRAEGASFAWRLLRAVAQPITFGAPDYPVIRQTCSIGWAAFPWHQDRPSETGFETVLGFADRALYEAKASGKNRGVGVSASGASNPTFVTTTAADVDAAYPTRPVFEAGSLGYDNPG